MTPKSKSARNEVLVMDPQCGKSVNAERAVRLRWEGKTYSFCSERCKARFEADPPGDAGF